MTLPASDSEQRLNDWMAAANIASVRSLSRLSGVSRRQIEKLRHGEAHLLSVHHAIQLAQTLKITLSDLLQLENSPLTDPLADPLAESAAVQAEYRRLQAEMATVRSQAFQSFQADTLNTLESLLLQWPTAAHKAQQNPTLSALRLLPLLKPLDQLLQGWQIEPIGAVGQVVPYTPQSHQWVGETAPPEVNCPVQISHVGYRQADQLLYRAKVRLPAPEATGTR